MEVVAVYAIMITDQILRSIVEREGIDDLLCCPCRGWMRRDINVNDPAPIVPEHDEAVEHSEADRVNGEEVDRGDVLYMVLQE